MKKIPFNNDPFKQSPQFAKFTHRCVKVILFNLDGTESEVKLTWPKVSDWIEDQEIANCYISEMVEHWCMSWIKIKAYQVHLGSVNISGAEQYGISYPIVEIPLNKVYHPQTRTWQDPETIIKSKLRQRQDRAGFIYLKQYSHETQTMSFSFEEASSFAFDASLCDEEAKEFQETIFRAKQEAETKGRNYMSAVFFVRPESGALDYRFND